MSMKVHDLDRREVISAVTFEDAQRVRLDRIAAGSDPAGVRLINAEGQDVTPMARRRGRPPILGLEPRSMNSGSLRLRPATILWVNAAADRAGITRSEWVSDLLDGLAKGRTKIVEDPS